MNEKTRTMDLMMDSVPEDRNEKKIASLLLDVGEALLSCGAEVSRVEDTLHRLSSAYGAEKTDVFVITESIVFTVTFPGKDPYTVSRRTTYAAETDFRKLEDLNALSRQVCAKVLPPEEFHQRVKAILEQRSRVYRQYLAGLLASGGFCYFFGGNLFDAIAAALMGMLTIFASGKLPKIIPNKTAYYLICSALVGIVIYLSDFFLPELHQDKIAIGVVMLLIPGITTTVAVRDVLTGDTISGALKLIQCLVWSLMIACGFMAAIRLTGAEPGSTPVVDGLNQLIPAMIGSLGFSLLFNLRERYLLVASLGGMVCWGCFLLFECGLGLDIFWCSLIAALLADFLAQLLARIMKTPTTLFLIPFVVPLIPGSSLYYTAASVVQNASDSVIHYGFNTILVDLGIAFGIGISANLFTQIAFIIRKQHKK